MDWPPRRAASKSTRRAHSLSDTPLVFAAALRVLASPGPSGMLMMVSPLSCAAVAGSAARAAAMFKLVSSISRRVRPLQSSSIGLRTHSISLSAKLGISTSCAPRVGPDRPPDRQGYPGRTRVVALSHGAAADPLDESVEVRPGDVRSADSVVLQQAAVADPLEFRVPGGPGRKVDLAVPVDAAVVQLLDCFDVFGREFSEDPVSLVPELLLDRLLHRLVPGGVVPEAALHEHHARF